MCGIAGIYHYRKTVQAVDKATVVAMTRSLQHRGPDGEGIWLDSEIGFGHRRLSVIDVSERGKQPMTSANQEVVVTFNGEIYNFQDLRQQLIAKGHQFHSETDTEVIIAGYQQWGVDVVNHLNGMFAFALWDKVKRRLFLARDPLGIKPLFYAIDDKRCHFASEIKGILSDPSIPRDSDPSALHSFFTLSYTPAPKTGFQRIRQLPPAHCVLIDETGPKTWRYWDIEYQETATECDFETSVATFSAKLDSVTASQMVSDVPLGAFLSGGLDSAAIVRSMTKANHGAVGALCVGFPDAGFDESTLAKESAAQLGIPIHVEELSFDPAAQLTQLALHTEEPFADSSIFATYLLCQTARKQFTVCLSGDGADEILAGYDTYRATALARYYRLFPSFLRSTVIKPLAKLLPVSDKKYSLYKRANRFAYAADLETDAHTHAAWRIIVDSDMGKTLFSKEFRAATIGSDPIADYARHASVPPQSRGGLTGLLHADTAFYLPNDMLVKVDRMSMAHGLEVRVPFLDKDFVQYAANLPDSYKLNNGKIRKHILRESLRGSVPDRVINARKSGFNVPLEAWMRGALYEMLLDNVETHRHQLSQFFRPEAIVALAGAHRRRAADHAHLLFTVLMFTQWLHNVKNAWNCSGTGVEELSQHGSSSQT